MLDHHHRFRATQRFQRFSALTLQLSPRGRQLVLVRHPYFHRDARQCPARSRSISCCQLFSSHRTRWRRFGSARWTGFVFPRANHGFAHGLPASAVWDRTSYSRLGRNWFYARTWPAHYRDHAGGAHWRGVYSGIGNDAGFRRSRGHRGDGNWAASIPGRTKNGGIISPDALSLGHFQYFSDFRQQSGFSCLFQHRLCLLSRSGQRRVTYPRHYYRRLEKLPLRFAHRCDRLLSGPNRARRGGGGRYGDNVKRRHCHHCRDRFRYTLQHRLHRVLSFMSANSSRMVELRDVRKQFDETKVLDGMSLEVERCDRLVIMGQSGSGKSTILRLILGILQPDAGSIFFKQFEVTRLRRRKLQRIRQHIGMVYQYSALLSSRNVRDNVALPLEELTDKSRKEIDKIVDQKLELVDMMEAKELMPEELSGGMKKRVSLARALVMEPELILFDDPSAGLDPVISSVIDELIISLTESSKVTSIIVTHEMDSAFRIGTRMAMLYQGKIIEQGEAETFKNSTNPVVAQFLSGSTEGPILEGSKDAVAKK